MKYLIKIYLEHKNNVVREIAIPSKYTLKDLHNTIIDSLELDKNQIASFYTTNEELQLIKEIPCFKINENDTSTLDMSEILIESIFLDVNSKLIYIYDFLKMWRFLISYSEKVDDSSQSIKIIKSIGIMPKDSPEIIFESENNFENNINEYD